MLGVYVPLLKGIAWFSASCCHLAVQLRAGLAVPLQAVATGVWLYVSRTALMARFMLPWLLWRSNNAVLAVHAQHWYTL